jgi:L-ascorbate metabolism protein UlaG (beta-lactamase superfamily)
MRVEWYGQSAFSLSDGETKVFIDPFGEMSGLEDRGITWEYPAIEAGGVDLLLVTHEHSDHNGVEAIAGAPELLRSTPGAHETGICDVLAIASEHDPAAGTERGANTILVFELGGLRIAHFGDFGQAALRPEQRAAIGAVDLLFLPVGGGPTIDGTAAAGLAAELDAAWVVPMHYRTPRISFLETEEEFVAAMADVQRFDSPAFETDELRREGGPLVVVPAVP